MLSARMSPLRGSVAKLVWQRYGHAELAERRMELEEVFSVGNGPSRKIIRFFGDDARVPFEVPHRGAAKRCLLRRAQLRELWQRFDRGGHEETLATGSAIIVAGVCR